MNRKLPKEIENCPIVDAVAEIRFQSKVNPSVIFGIIYSVLQKDFKNIQNLPILQLPEPIRISDPNLKYKPLYKISNKEFVVQIGSDVISIGSYPKYVGWSRFSNKIFDILNRIDTLKVIGKVERVGLRYINFFSDNIFDNIKLGISLNTKKYQFNNTVIRADIPQGIYSSTLQISNNAISNSVHGSIIDIDTHKEKGLQNFFKDKESIINEGHQKEKELFFDLLKDDYLKILNPKY